MFKKRYAFLVLLSLLICMIAISSASAAETAMADDLTVGDDAAVSVDEVVNDDNVLNSDNKEIANEEVLAIDDKETANQEVLASDNNSEEIVSLDNSDEVLSSSSPAYTDYSVKFQKSSYSWSWSDGGKVNIDITPTNEPYYYDFYFKIVKNGNQIFSKNIYTSNEDDRDYYNEYYYPYNFEARSSDYGVGTYSLQLVNYKDGYVFDNATLKVTAGQGKLTVTQAGKYATNKKLTFKLVDKTSGKAIANQRINLRFSNGVSTFVKTNSKGVATYNMKFKPGTYTVIASVPGSAVKVANKQVGNLKIVKTPVTLNPRPLVTPYASGKYFNIKVTDNAKKPIGGVKLKVDIYTGNAKKTVVLKTISTGWAKVGASKLEIGNHKVVVSVASTGLHIGSAKASTITVKKAGVSINAPKGTTNAYKQDGFYRVRLTNYASGAALSGVTVTLKVYTGSTFKTFNVKTNENGVASISTKALSKGKHTVVASYAGTKYLKPNTVKGAVTITNKIPTHFSYSGGLIFHAYQSWTSQYSFISVATSVEVPVHLYDNNGNEIIRTVTVTHSSSGDSVTDKSGQYIWITGGRPGSAILTFNGDSKYMPCTYSIDLGYDN